MSLLSKFFPRKDDRAGLKLLYSALIEAAREPHWYVAGEVPDTLDGRFDMVAATLSLVLIRLDELDSAAEAALLTEWFIDDMDGQIRQIGFGDIVVGKQIGRMVGALGGRLSAYRAGLSGKAPLAEALVRNLYRGATPTPAALDYVESQIRLLAEEIDSRDLATLLAGRLRD